MKLWVIGACLASVWLSQPPTKPQAGDIFKSVDVRDWLGAAIEHEPGVEDAALRRISGWSGGKLLRTLGTVLKEQSSDELNAMLERAALLHADMVILRRESNPAWPDAPEMSGSSILSNDGQRLGTRPLDPHLQFARMIFKHMRPPPLALGAPRTAAPAWAEAHRHNPRIQQWYHTVSTELAARHWLADLRPHLEDARLVLDDTPETLFDSACFSEVMASAQVQRAIEPSVSASAPPSVRLRVQSASLHLDERYNLSEAERFYRDALKLDPGYSEARVRLARVLSLRNKAANAAALLQAPIETTNAFVRYWGALALGQATEATQKPEIANEAYRQAAELFPRAQSPLLALLRLARERGDDAGAKELGSRVSLLPANEQHRLDPWWDYFDCHGRYRDEERERLWALYRSTARQ